MWVLFLSTIFNYVNRQNFSVLAPVITQQFHLSHTDLSKSFGSFQIAYAVTRLRDSRDCPCRRIVSSGRRSKVSILLGTYKVILLDALYTALDFAVDDN